MRLGLGTVQFGLDYGITNRQGRVSRSEASAILAHAAEHGVKTLDTAALYGDAEAALGATLPRPHLFSIVTKTLALDTAAPASDPVAAIRTGVLRSLERLGETQLSGLLVHRVADLLGPHGPKLYDLLSKLKQEGLVERIGASVYTPDEVAKLLHLYRLDVVQLPLNVFDQRHLDQGSLSKLAAAGVEVHVRSAFLQGLLLAETPHLPPGLEALAPILQDWRVTARSLGLSLLEACFAFLKGLRCPGVVVCGATSLEEWQEVVAAHAAAPALPPETFKMLAVADDNLIDPRYWPQR